MGASRRSWRGLRGARVVGSAGTAEKVAWLEELGLEGVFDYTQVPTAEALREQAPDGIDVYFDNVGGETLEAAIGALRLHGRVVACGAISRYNATEAQPGPRNLFMLVTKRLRLEGFLVFDYVERTAAFLDEVAPLVADGAIRHRETIVDGIERAPEAFIGLLSGANVGKMLVRVAAGPVREQDSAERNPAADPRLRRGRSLKAPASRSNRLVARCGVEPARALFRRDPRIRRVTRRRRAPPGASATYAASASGPSSATWTGVSRRRRRRRARRPPQPARASRCRSRRTAGRPRPVGRARRGPRGPTRARCAHRSCR